MTVHVRLPALFADRIDGASRVTISATSVEGVLRALSQKHPPLEKLLFAPNGTVNPMMVVFLNDTQLETNKLRSPVSEGDEIQIVPAIEGG